VRGIDVTYETIRHWALKFGSAYAHRLRRLRPRPDCRWHLDEVFVLINGKQMYLWRAVDEGSEKRQAWLVSAAANVKARLFEIGAKIVTHARYVIFQMAEVAVPKELFQEILRPIDRLRPRPAPA
jgi:hypothetical protein